LCILKIDTLNKRYGDHVALKDFNLEVPKGIVFGLLGPNGAGKTTLIRIVNQIIDQDSGKIWINNERLKLSHVRNIGYLPEERGLYKAMKVEDQLLYFAQIKGLDAKTAAIKTKDWLEKLNLSPWRYKKIQELSKGMAQKVQFIATVIHEPNLLILDEPFSGFDPVNAEVIKNEILELKNKGTTIILSTHRMESVELLCDHIAMINKAVKILDGPVKEIKKSSKLHRYKVKLVPKEGMVLPSFDHFKQEEDQVSFTLSMMDQSPNLLIQELMEYGELHGFEEMIPTIEEIFIQKINDTHGQ
jgi:ABC-2 type transport system ATP-binding protein